MHLLGMDTCGGSGSIALGRVEPTGELTLLGESRLEGRTYSSALVPSIRALLGAHGLTPAGLAAIAVTRGPGSFTGVRVGLSTAQGLAEPARTPLIALSRLAVMAAASGIDSAALDAHRHEVFLRLAAAGRAATEQLAGTEELAALAAPERIAVCDAAAAELIEAAWPGTAIQQCPAPVAADLLRLAVPRLLAGEFDDPLALDGHYLRRSDAEIFGAPDAPPRRP